MNILAPRILKWVLGFGKFVHYLYEIWKECTSQSSIFLYVSKFSVLKRTLLQFDMLVRVAVRLSTKNMEVFETKCRAEYIDVKERGKQEV